MLTFQLSNPAAPDSMLYAIDAETGELIAWLGGYTEWGGGLGDPWVPTLKFFAGPWETRDDDRDVKEFTNLDLAKSWVIQTMG